MREKEFTGIRDWKLNDINEGSIVVTEQGTKFVIEWSEEHEEWCLIQSNEGIVPDLQGDRFSLKKYMQPNLEVIGNIYDNPKLMNGNDI